LLASLQSLNLFWLFYIFRIAYRFVFAGVAEDDRSDNEEVELAQEAAEDRLRRARAEGKGGPSITLNGLPVGSASGVEVKTDSLTNRKEAVVART
jgi:acyl-CoA-dependent ceramide synthase